MVLGYGHQETQHYTRDSLLLASSYLGHGGVEESEDLQDKWSDRCELPSEVVGLSSDHGLYGGSGILMSHAT
jgi:hypothetical protein